MTYTKAVVMGAGVTVVVGLGVAQRARRVDAVWSPGGGTIHDGTLSARVLGAAGPPRAVLLHGLGGSNRYWGAAYDPLAGDGCLVVPDLLGFGRSPRPDDGYGVDSHVDAVAACLGELGADAPLVVGAHSLGCVVALGLAARHPNLVERIVGFGPPLYADSFTARERIAHLGFLQRQLARELPFAAASCRWMCRHRAAAARVGQLLRPGLPWPIVLDGVEHNWVSYSKTLDRVLVAAPGDGFLDHTDIPVTLVAGLADLVPDRAHLRDLARRHSNIRIIEREGDHDLPLTDPFWCLSQLQART